MTNRSLIKPKLNENITKLVVQYKCLNDRRL